MTIYSNPIRSTSNACCKLPQALRLYRPGALQLLCCLLLPMLASCASKPVIKPSVEELQSRQQRQADATARETQTDPATAAVLEDSPAVKELLTNAETAREEENFSLANLLLERALRIAPSQADIYLGLARLRMDQTLPEEALAFVQRGLALQPQTEVKAQLQATGVIAKEAISSTATPLGS